MDYTTSFLDEKTGETKFIDFKSKIGLGIIESSFVGDHLTTKVPTIDLIQEAEQAVIKAFGHNFKFKLRAVYALVIGPDEI